MVSESGFVKQKAEYVLLTLSVAVFAFLLVFAIKQTYTGLSIQEEVCGSTKILEKVPDIAKDNDNHTRTFKVSQSDNIYLTQYVYTSPKYIYLEWTNNVSQFESVLDSVLYLEHKEFFVNMTVQIWDNSWIDVCNMPARNKDHIDNCSLNNYIDSPEKAANVKIRLKLMRTNKCYENLDWASLKITYCAKPLVSHSVLVLSNDTVIKGQSVSIDGYNFSKNNQVGILIKDSSNAEVFTINLTTDSNGGFSYLYNTSSLEPGNYTVYAVDFTAPVNNKNVPLHILPVPVSHSVLLITPDIAVRGSKVHIDGYNFTASSNIIILIKDANGTIVFSDNITTSIDGSFSYLYNTKDLVPGIYTVAANDVSHPINDKNASLEITAPISLLILIPNPVVQGGIEFVLGDGFSVNSTVEIIIKDSNGTIVLAHNVTTSSEGVFNYSFNTASLPPGNYTVYANDLENPLNNKNETLEILPPNSVLIITPGTVTQGDNVTVEGYNFSINSTVEIIIKDSNGTIVLSENLTTSTDGSFTFTFNTSTFLPGNYTLFVNDSSNPLLNKNATFTVSPKESHSALIVTPDEVVRGYDVNIQGYNFSASSTVEIIIKDSNGTVVLSHNVTTSSDGSFNYSFSTLTMPPGDYTVYANDLDNPLNNKNATFTILPSNSALIVTPAKVTKGASVQIKGHNFSANNAVQIKIKNNVNAVVFSVNLTTSLNGSFTYSFNTSILSPGNYTVYAYDANPMNDRNKTLEVTKKSGGGGGGGGCTPSWSCTAWSSCVNNKQTRTCTDLNDCGTNAGKPSELTDCTPAGQPETGGEGVGEAGKGTEQNVSAEGQEGEGAVQLPFGLGNKRCQPLTWPFWILYVLVIGLSGFSIYKFKRFPKLIHRNKSIVWVLASCNLLLAILTAIDIYCWPRWYIGLAIVPPAAGIVLLLGFIFEKLRII